MLSNTWDARRICRFLGYIRYILVIRMVREYYYKDGSIYHITYAKHITGYTMYYKEVKVRIIYFLRKFKSFGKFKSFVKV
jgi:hypothetical protein